MTFPASFGDDLDLESVRNIARAIDPEGKRELSLSPGDERADNDLRAAWGFLGLDAYVRRVSPTGDSWEGMLGDLFSDLMHLCNAVGVDPDDTVDKATRRYTEELYGEV